MNFVVDCANKRKFKKPMKKAMATTWDDNSDESDYEQQVNEDESSQGIKVFVAFTKRTQDESQSVEEQQEEE